MSEIQEETIYHLGKLCRIHVTRENAKRLKQDMESILSYVEQLQALDTSDKTPCYQVIPEIESAVREDEVDGELLDVEDFLRNAPDRIGRMVRVPPVLKG